VQVAALSSTLAGAEGPPEGVVALRATYPISRYFAAFDMVVAASGYNAYHELIQLGPPSLFVPMPRQTDDQAARARYAEERGVGIACAGPDDPTIEAKLDAVLDPAGRASMAERLAASRGENGAADAARWLEELAGGGALPPVDRGGARPVASSSTRRAWIFASSVPRTAARIGRQVLTRPRPRTLLIALGLGREGLAREVQGALERTGERPERALVITDTLDYAPLLAAGVGFEHLPGPGCRQAELAGVPYGEFRLERLRAILAARPRPRRVLGLWNAPAELVEAARRR
jgi:hypothetical protein